MPPNKPRKPNTIEEALAGVLSKIYALIPARLVKRATLPPPLQV